MCGEQNYNERLIEMTVVRAKSCLFCTNKGLRVLLEHISSMRRFEFVFQAKMLCLFNCLQLSVVLCCVLNLCCISLQTFLKSGGTHWVSWYQYLLLFWELWHSILHSQEFNTYLLGPLSLLLSAASPASKICRPLPNFSSWVAHRVACICGKTPSRTEMPTCIALWHFKCLSAHCKTHQSQVRWKPVQRWPFLSSYSVLARKEIRAFWLRSPLIFKQSDWFGWWKPRGFMVPG